MDAGRQSQQGSFVQRTAYTVTPSTPRMPNPEGQEGKCKEQEMGETMSERWRVQVRRRSGERPWVGKERRGGESEEMEQNDRGGYSRQWGGGKAPETPRAFTAPQGPANPSKTYCYKLQKTLKEAGF